MKKNTNQATLGNQAKPIGLNVLVQELENELLLYDLKRDKAFCLNETSMLIWNLCDGKNTVEDIRRQVSIQLKIQITDEIIWLALDNLKREQLLSNPQEININFNGLNRREVIRKVGFSTMVALPLISAIVSPIAAAAQSQSCSGLTFCQCQDLSCTQFGDPALLQNPCQDINMICGGGGLINCVCVGMFFCDQNDGIRFGMCGLI